MYVGACMHLCTCLCMQISHFLFHIRHEFNFSEVHAGIACKVNEPEGAHVIFARDPLRFIPS